MVLLSRRTACLSIKSIFLIRVFGAVYRALWNKNLHGCVFNVESTQEGCNIS